MPRFALTIRLLYRILTIGILCLFANADDLRAAEASVKVIQNGLLKDSLVMQFRAEGIFTEKVIKFLNRGFTVKVDYKVELWQSRKYWFDRLDSQHSVSYQIDFEPLEKRYVCLKSQQKAFASAITSKIDQQLDKIIQWVTQPEPSLNIVPADRLDPESGYYYNIEILIATLTAENVKDLQRWLSEFSEKGEEPSTFTKTSFKVAADFISSKNHKKLSSRSDKFYVYNLPKLDK